jgi:hypothetical protein
MKQPNTHHIRRFLDRAAGVTHGQVVGLNQKEIYDLSIGLNDVLLYQKELEDHIRDLQERLSAAESVTVEMEGEKF